MNLRVPLGRFLIRLGNFIGSLSLVVMRPADLIEFNRRRYNSSKAIAVWGEDSFVDQGLSPQEQDLLAQLPRQSGRLLLLGLGGGRDAIALAKMGFEVVGVDFSGDLVAKAQEHAARHGVTLEGLVQEFSQLEVPAASFHLVVIFGATYSCIPTRRRRVEMLQRIYAALRPGGHLLCQFFLDPDRKFNPRADLARTVFAFLTRGNRGYEPGDAIWGSEFMHLFLSEGKLQEEFAAAGFEILYFQPQEFGTWRGAVLQRPI